MRSDKELFEIMLSRIDILQSGLCNLSTQLLWNEITWEEKIRINYLLKLNQPRTLYDIIVNDYFWWKPGSKFFRKRWLKKFIKKIEKGEYNK